MTTCHPDSPCRTNHSILTGLPKLRSAEPALLRASLAALALLLLMGIPALMAPAPDLSAGEAASLQVEWHGNTGSTRQPR